MSEQESTDGGIDHRTTCTECNSNDTHRIDIEEPTNITDKGTCLIEARACKACGAGYRIKYRGESKERTHPPAVEPDT